MKKTKYIQIRIDSELKEKAVEAANKDGRTLSNWILKIIKKELEESLKNVLTM